MALSYPSFLFSWAQVKDTSHQFQPTETPAKTYQWTSAKTHLFCVYTLCTAAGDFLISAD